MFDREFAYAYFFHYRFHYLWQDWGRLVNQAIPTMNTHNLCDFIGKQINESNSKCYALPKSLDDFSL